MNSIKDLIIKIFYSLIGVISAILLIRFVIDQLETNEDHGLIAFLITISEGFVSPFKEILPETSNFPIVLDAGFAVLIYIIWGVLLSIFIASFFQESRKEIFKDSTDSVFKFVESLLVIRILSDFFGLNSETPFIELINNLTLWSDGVIRREIFDGRLNISAMVTLLIIVILDLIAERIIDMLVTEEKKEI